MIAVLTLSGALGGELQFAPDRPGVGDSTITTGAGHATIELGLAAALSSDGTTVSTGGLLGRIGLDDGLELRLRLPDPFLADGDPGVGSAGLGAKVGGAIGDRWSSSVVAEVNVDPNDGTVGGALGANVAASFDAIGLWFAGAAGGAEAVEVFAGGGLGWGIDEGGLFVNGGHTFGGPSLLGVGGYVLPSPTVQLDASVDFAFAGDAPFTVLPGVGVAFGL
ncbi:MAG: hypothetical protein AAF211_16115 [Myxococcota bacterium]